MYTEHFLWGKHYARMKQRNKRSQYFSSWGEDILAGEMSCEKLNNKYFHNRCYNSL